jgi:hypothetical protein
MIVIGAARKSAAFGRQETLAENSTCGYAAVLCYEPGEQRLFEPNPI